MSCKHQFEELSAVLEEDCCNTACLIQPRFFHGQLLTDADLNQLLSWTEGKFRLQRTLHGWGVVCGLHLSLDPEHPTHVIIQPGQGIDCCGRDLVVCEPISFNVSDACPKEECLEPTYNRWGKTTPDVNAKASQAGAYDQPEVKPVSLQTLFEGSQMLDLFLHYSTEGNDAQVRLGGQGNECEYSRLKETVKPKWEIARDPGVENAQQVNNFVAAYEVKRINYLYSIQTARRKADAGDSLRAWFLQGMDAQPLNQFGFVRDWVNVLENNDVVNNPVQILFYKNMDDLLAWARCDCLGCSSETGLLVGRVWLQGPDAASGEDCRIIHVSNQPPYRRELRSEPCYPASPGCVNLAPYLWQNWNTVKDSLTKLGVAVGDPYEKKFSELDWDVLEEIYKQTDQIINCDQTGNPLPVRATVVYMDPPFEDRVVGFSF
jgi:hypothetical protein